MSNDGVNQGRRRVLTALTSVVGAAGVVGAAVPFVNSWNPSAKAKAAGAPVEFNISKIEPGARVTVEWRGKPVYIVRRTKEALATLASVAERLSDPNSEKSEQPSYAKNATRSVREEYLVMLAVCTHLGCAPEYRPEAGDTEVDANWQGGFFCKCHGSKFDLAGRVFQGVPAPTNLEIPPYIFLTDDIVLIGEDQEA